MARTLQGCVVADPKICHGQLTFRGTRILVSQVLDEVASGRSWEGIIDDWGGAQSARRRSATPCGWRAACF